MKKAGAVLLSLAALFAENIRGLVVLIGAVWCYYGLAEVDRAVANISAGVALMVAGLYPYMRGRH